MEQLAGSISTEGRAICLIALQESLMAIENENKQDLEIFLSGLLKYLNKKDCFKFKMFLELATYEDKERNQKDESCPESE